MLGLFGQTQPSKSLLNNRREGWGVGGGGITMAFSYFKTLD